MAKWKQRSGYVMPGMFSSFILFINAIVCKSRDIFFSILEPIPILNIVCVSTSYDCYTCAIATKFPHLIKLFNTQMRYLVLQCRGFIRFENIFSFTRKVTLVYGWNFF